MLECSDQSYYVGVTSDLEKRIHEHQHGIFKGYTSARLPVKLVWSQEFQDVNEAIKVEKQIKDWSRAKKKALINNDWDSVKFFAMRKQPNLGK